jgi:hypothetical protein
MLAKQLLLQLDELMPLSTTVAVKKHTINGKLIGTVYLTVSEHECSQHLSFTTPGLPRHWYFKRFCTFIVAQTPIPVGMYSKLTWGWPVDRKGRQASEDSNLDYPVNPNNRILSIGLNCIRRYQSP